MTGNKKSLIATHRYPCDKYLVSDMQLKLIITEVYESVEGKECIGNGR